MLNFIYVAQASLFGSDPADACSTFLGGCAGAVWSCFGGLVHGREISATEAGLETEEVRLVA